MSYYSVEMVSTRRLKVMVIAVSVETVNESELWAETTDLQVESGCLLQCWTESRLQHHTVVLYSATRSVFSVQCLAQGLGIEPPTSQLVNTQLLLRSHSRLYRLKNHTHTHTHTHTHNTQQQPAAYMQRWEGSLTRWGWMAQAVHWCIMGHDWRASHLFILVRLVC